VHLSLHERGRRRQLDAIAARLEQLIASKMPVIVAGDFNDWRQQASGILEKSLGMTDVAVASANAHQRTFPSRLPLLRLDRIYARGFALVRSEVPRGAPWSLLSDHLALSAELERD
jgi:endonuclease/exonuclease/phosphatase family metal-dependent hydrolase